MPIIVCHIRFSFIARPDRTLRFYSVRVQRIAVSPGNFRNKAQISAGNIFASDRSGQPVAGRRPEIIDLFSLYAARLRRVYNRRRQRMFTLFLQRIRQHPQMII